MQLILAIDCSESRQNQAIVEQMQVDVLKINAGSTSHNAISNQLATRFQQMQVINIFAVLTIVNQLLMQQLESKLVVGYSGFRVDLCQSQLHIADCLVQNVTVVVL